MEEAAPRPPSTDDPRRIREHLRRTCELASTLGVPSVVVGLAGAEGDRMAPALIDFVESALRVEDGIFRMTRERAVLFLADVGRDGAEEIVARLLDGFVERFPSASDPGIRLGYYAAAPDCGDLLVKDVLPAVFPHAVPRDAH